MKKALFLVGLCFLSGCYIQERRYREASYPDVMYKTPQSTYNLEKPYTTTEGCPYSWGCYQEGGTMEQLPVYQPVLQPSGDNPAEPAFVVMQHPVKGTVIRCPLSNVSCIYQAEKEGYTKSHELPYMANQGEPQGYPGGRWQYQDSVPRW